jgi:hypothetical protein
MSIMTKIQVQIDSLFFKFLSLLVDPNDLDVIVKEWPTIWEDIQDPNYYFLGGQHTIEVIKVNYLLNFSPSSIFFHNFDEKKYIHIHMWILGDISNNGGFKKDFFLIIQIFKLLLYGVKIPWNYATCHLSSTTHTLSSKLHLHIKNASNMLGRSKLNTNVQSGILILIIKRTHTR